ncbi:MAG: hypothetical protein Q8R08_03435 [bacterium]|nr:hypothetical protein [bacterium]
MRGLLFCLAVMLTPFPGAACDCKTLTVQKSLQDADVVFSGKVTDSKTVGFKGRFLGETITVYTLKVSDVWKGDVPPTVAFYHYSLDSECSNVPFRKSEEWLIYAYTSQKSLIDELWKQVRSQGFTRPAFFYLTGICTRTRWLSDAQEDLRELGQSKPPRVK